MNGPDIFSDPFDEGERAHIETLRKLSYTYRLKAFRACLDNAITQAEGLESMLGFNPVDIDMIMREKLNGHWMVHIASLSEHFNEENRVQALNQVLTNTMENMDKGVDIVHDILNNKDSQ